MSQFSTFMNHGIFVNCVHTAIEITNNIPSNKKKIFVGLLIVLPQ